MALTVIALVLWLLLPVARAALPWLPPSQTFGCFVAAVQPMLTVAALFVGMPAENLSKTVVARVTVGSDPAPTGQVNGL
ncbi:hypothetical protein ACWC9U_11995 [Streptomyces sp. 900116325]